MEDKVARRRAGQTFSDPPETPEANGLRPVDEDGPVAGRYLSAEEIFAIDDIQTKEVWVPEWRTNIILITLTGAERDKYFSSIQYTDKRGRQLVDSEASNAKLLVLAARNPDGSSLFTIHQVRRLQMKNAAVITRLANIAGEMNGFGQTEDDDRERRQALD
jgi:hypothetical protein